MTRFALFHLSVLLLGCLVFACDSSPDGQQRSSSPTPPAGDSPAATVAHAETTTTSNVSADAAPSEKQACERVLQELLDQLYEAGGDFRWKKPAIEWAARTGKVASFGPNQQKICIEKNAYDACRSMGKDSLAALAFLVGHELAHFYREQEKPSGKPTDFLAFHQPGNAVLEEEIACDLQGIFLAQVAGYQNVREALPKLLDRIYEAYSLENETLSNYPPKRQRQVFGEVVRGRADTLFHVFQAATYLTGFEKYAEAAACFEHLLRFYNGSEVWNNLGVLYAMQAMRVGGKTPDEFWYPFELQTHSRLSAARSAPAELTEAQKWERKLWLGKAHRCFETAVKMNPRSRAAQANTLCAGLLSGNAAGVLERLQNEKLPLPADLKKLLLALANAHLEQHRAESLPMFQALEKSADRQVAMLARFNAAVLQGAQIQVFPKECPVDVVRYPDQVKWSELARAPGFSLGKESGAALQWEAGKQATLYVVHLGGEQVSFQVIGKPIEQSAVFVEPVVQVGLIFQGERWQDCEQVLLPARLGQFWHASPCKLVVRSDRKGKVQEWALAHE